ncbi:Rab proteins geranylgeranyltransferase component A [Cladobotryum mycophilum]|uniref:Rab proteins geranylgeranyltransferase n=1 Tax=Cladobotryum mycophilum TaxID=491253 RepID=A0ABR0SG05_9HYPO
MESLSDIKWDVVISGTGLQQSLLALALSRSGKNILHVDPNEYYGAAEAALSLQEVDEWAEKHRAAGGDGIFSAAQVTRHEGSEALAFSRAYSLALAPQLIHTRSELLSQLVSSKAFRQIEFLAVGSFYIYQPASDASQPAALSRIPSTREDIFSNTAIPAKSKRSLMKFLKFVLEYTSESHTEVWKPHADEPLSGFLATAFKLDAALQAYIVTLTLSLDGKITVQAGLASIHRHLTSMGVFGAGFAAVYPKWGGLSEVAQVGCRASAVGGAVYMLGVGIKGVQKSLPTEENKEGGLDVALANDVTVKSRRLIQASTGAAADSLRVSRLTAVVNSNLLPLFETVVEGAPTPSVTVIAFPAGSALGEDGSSSDFPIYAMAHSSDAGECPSGQSVIYLSTVSSPNSQDHLGRALSSLLTAAKPGEQTAGPLYQLSYEQTGINGASLSVEENIASFSLPPLDLAFNDSVLGPVKEAWEFIMSDIVSEEREDYMAFKDREGAEIDEDEFDN